MTKAKVFGIASAALALGLIVALLLCEAYGWPFLRAPLQRRLTAACGQAVELQPPFSLRLLGSVRLHAAGLTIADADGRAWLDARRIGVVLSWPTLLQVARHAGGRPFVDELVAHELALDVERDASGRTHGCFGRPEPAASTSANSVVERLPRFGRLIVHDGHVRLVDAPLRIEVDASLRTNEGNEASAAAASAASQAAGPAPPGGAAPAPGLELRAQGRYRGLPLRLWLESSGALPLLGGSPTLVPVQIDARLGRAHLRLDGSISDVLHQRRLRGRFDLSGPSLAAVGDALGITLPTTAAFRMQGGIAKDADVWEASIDRLAVGSSRLGGRFRFDPTPAVPMLTGSLTGERLLLADLGPALGAPTETSPTDSKPAGRVLPRREFDIPSLRAMNADVQIDLARVDLGTKTLAPLAPLRGRLRLTDAVLTLDDMLARTADGEASGQLMLDARTEAPHWRADLRVAGVRLERFVSVPDPYLRTAAAAGPAASAAATGYVSGQLGGRARLRGVGRSTAAMLASLDGSVQAWVDRGRISHLLVEAAGIDIAESLGLVLGGDETLPLRCAMAQFVVHDGVLQPQLALVDTADSTLRLDGRVSLADESLALVLDAQPHDVSPLTLRAPVRIGGSLARPTARPDAKPLALKLGAAAALGALVNPLAALLPLFDLGEEDREACHELLAGAPRHRLPGREAGRR